MITHDGQTKWHRVKKVKGMKTIACERPRIRNLDQLEDVILKTNFQCLSEQVKSGGEERLDKLGKYSPAIEGVEESDFHPYSFW